MPIGAPHVIPIWGAWVDGRWYVEGGPTRWQRNLRENPQMAIHLELGDEVVIVEGTAVELVAPDAAVSDAILGGYAKYKAAAATRPPDQLDAGRPVGAAPGQGLRLVDLPDRHDALPLLTTAGMDAAPGECPGPLEEREARQLFVCAVQVTWLM